MWPSKGKGVSLGYGHDGSILYLPSDHERPLRLARRHGLGYTFHDIKYTRTLIAAAKQFNEAAEQNTDHARGKYYMYLNKSGARDFVPSDIMADYSAESGHLISSNGYDPMTGHLMSVGPLRKTSRFTQQCLAFAGGDSRSKLCVSKLSILKKRVESNDFNPLSVEIPSLGETAQLELGSLIQQVEIATAPISSFILTRTTLGLSLIRANLGTNSSDMSLVESKSLESPGPDNFCDSVINPWNSKQLATVDSRGSWSVWNVRTSIISAGYSGKPHSSARHFSRWNRILWGHDETSVLVANRRTLLSHDLRGPDANNSTEMFSCPRGLSRICDIVRSERNSHEAFVLTSDKVVWLDSRRPDKTLLTWDHFMHSQDPSLKMSMSTSDNITSLTLYSQLVNTNLVYQFTTSDELPVSADDPYYYLSRSDSINQTLINLPLKCDRQSHDMGAADPKFMASLAYSTDQKISRQILCTDKEIRIEKSLDDGNPTPSDSELEDIEPSQSDEMYTLENSTVLPIARTRHAQDVYLYDFRKLYHSLFIEDDANHLLPPVGDEDSIQQFAYKLAAKIKEKHRGHKSSIATLIELQAIDHIFEDLEGLSSMIEQLQAHYEDSSSIRVFPLAYGLGTLFDTNIKDISDIYEYLVSIWLTPLKHDIEQEARERREKMIRLIATDIAFSCMGVHINKRKKHAPNSDNISALDGLKPYQPSSTWDIELSDACKLLLNEWVPGKSVDNYVYSKFAEPVEEKTTAPEPSQVEYKMPSLQLSQSLQFTQPSQRSQGNKKKKRKAGFA